MSLASFTMLSSPLCGLSGLALAAIVNGQCSALSIVARRFTTCASLTGGAPMALEAEAAAGGLIRRVEKALGKGSPAAPLVPLLYAHDGLSGLEGLPAEWLANNAREAMAFIADKPKGRHKISVRRLAASSKGGPPPGSIVEILNDDMPFLVDSVLGELQARGLSVRLLFHPIFRTQRDRAGHLETIAGTGDERWGDGHQESYIAIHLRSLMPAEAGELTAALSGILEEVRVVVSDWQPMLERLEAGRKQLELAHGRLPPEALGEAIAFLSWLEQANFTFLGARSFVHMSDRDLQPVDDTGLGVLRDPTVQVLRRGTELVAMTPEVRRFFLEPAPLIITKANVVSRVHRRAHMDYIGVKTYRGDGTPKGETRFVGLFTSQAYVIPPSQIPLLRHKVETVLTASGYPAASHAGKGLLNILDTFPRDELFQIGAKELQAWCEGILDLETRPRVRAFTRIDRFDRFVSVLLYVPRDRYNTRVRERIGALLSATYDGRIAAFYPYFPEGPLVRVQFIVARFAGPTPQADVALLRAFAAYLRQLGSPFGLRYLAETLNRHAGLARDLIELFHLRFDPHRSLTAAQRQAGAAPIQQRIVGALAAVPSLDEDRILRQFHNLVDATVRTNFYVPDGEGRRPATLAFKLDSKAVAAAPQPRPFREIWIYSPRVEGIHLRFAAIARGGIRWSDRAQDFRTEILGLVRAQLVKNAVIVPSGAKGGFLPKQLPRSGAREEIQKEGVAAYRIFISALLDITDNIKGGNVQPPRHVLRHDGNDPYLVVAADKGTATFSDIANDISAAHDFWLGDAFASGGSAGYDHKRMAITARGAWECVKRHFREMDKDIQSEAFRVVGVGDMSGDVFGNGMLLSQHIELVAAFDHRDIFIDPNPSGAAFAERKRLFDLARSSWQDFDRAKISRGGGVFSRSAKSIALSEEMRRLLEADAANLTPAELMRAILKCKSDLLWFGGIGTYIRATGESDSEVGDRANDPLRVTAAEVTARVIGEGANLGVTQRARIEFAARGGRINTDFIDNSAGVNTSDQEVNIKIALAPAVRAGKLAAAARNALLAEMTEDVAAASLRNNYQQSLALSLAERRSAQELADYSLLMRTLEARGLFDRPLEALPSEMDLQERGRAGRGLTRPELAVLLSYAKIALQHDLLESRVPDEPGLEPWLSGYFPAALQARFGPEVEKHSLRREIIALGLTNAIVNRGGPAMAARLAEETQRSSADVAHAFLAAREVFELPALWQRIDALDGKAKGAAQLALYQVIQSLVNAQTLWFLRNGSAIADLEGTIARHRAGVAALKGALASVLTARRQALLAAEAARLRGAGVPVA